MAEKDSGTQNLRLFLKSLASYVFLVVSALIAVPLGLVWLANGLLAFSVGNLRFLGLLPTTVGTIFMLNMFVYFASVGKGTPAPFDPPKKLVTQGLFRYVRNPGYVGGVLILVGEGILLES